MSDRYEKASVTFQQWVRGETLERDRDSSFYLHHHRLKYAGEMQVRRGLVAHVKLEPWGVVCSLTRKHQLERKTIVCG